MSQPTIAKPTIRVLTYAGAGKGINELTKGIRAVAEDEMAKVDPARVTGTIVFDPPVSDVDGLARRLAGGRDTILHLVSHATPAGVIGIEDAWDSLRLRPETLARMVQGSGIRVVIVNTCHGATIAKALVDEWAVPVAIGYTEPLAMAAAVEMARGFYGALIQGKSPRQAATDGAIFAEPRMRKDEGKGELKIWSLRSEYPDDALFGPQFHIIGTPISPCKGAVAELTRCLAPYAVSHIDKARLGDVAGMEWSLRNARVVIALVDDEPTSDGERAGGFAFYEEIAAVVERARRGDAKVIPTVLAERMSDMPYGLKRLNPALLHRRYGGSYEALGQDLKRVLEQM